MINRVISRPRERAVVPFKNEISEERRQPLEDTFRVVAFDDSLGSMEC
jgi:hypothetical protein